MRRSIRWKIAAVSLFATAAILALAVPTPSAAKPKPMGASSHSCWGDSETLKVCFYKCFCCYENGCYVCDSNGHQCQWYDITQASIAVPPQGRPGTLEVAPSRNTPPKRPVVRPGLLDATPEPGAKGPAGTGTPAAPTAPPVKLQ
jgi:hypothetical protein